MKNFSNKIQLIVYPDGLGKNFSELESILDMYFSKNVRGVHILPFYSSSSDEGFSPINHFRINPKFGNWDDIERISKKYEVMTDMIINHVSQKSKYFTDYLLFKDKSPYADYFITAEKFSRRILRKRTFNPWFLYWVEILVNKIRQIDIIFHKGGVNRFTLKQIYRPRLGSPFEKFEFADGSAERIWCTFSRDQVDLDCENENVVKMFEEILGMLVRHGVRFVRLDAVGYCIKRRGTRNFMINETYAFIKSFARKAHKRNIKILPEIHSHFSVQVKLARTSGVDFVYDFALSLLVLEALFFRKSKNLKKWIRIRPKNQITTLDTHDGLPVPDVEGLMSGEEKDKVVALIHANGGNDTIRVSGANAKNVDVYQINCTYYSALGKNDDAYIAARAIQFFVPGVPQVYYVGMLAGENDVKLMEKTGIGRDINRHRYSKDEIEENLKRTVVTRLLRLMELRNTHSAFDGKFYMPKASENILKLKWENGDEFCEAMIDLKKYETKIVYSKNAKKIEDVF